MKKHLSGKTFAKYSQKLGSKITGYQLFQGLRLISVFAAGIILAKSGYSTADIGFYESFIMMSASLSFFWLSGILNSLLVLSGNTDHSGKRALLQQSWLLTILLSLTGAALSYLFNHGTLSGPIWLLPVYLILNNSAYAADWHLLSNNKNKALIQLGALNLILQLFVFALLAITHAPIKAFIYALIVLALLRNLPALWFILKEGWQLSNSSFLKEQWILGLPIALSAFTAGSSEYIDGYIVKHFYGDAVFSIFRYGARELPFVILLANALSISMLPAISANTEKGIQDLKNRSRFLMWLCFPLAILLLLTSRWLYPLAFNSHFKESAQYFNVFCLLVISRLIFPQTILSAKKHTRWLFIVSVTELASNLFFSLWLMQYYGVMGVAIGSIVTAAIENVLLVILCRKLTGIKLSDYTDLKIYIPMSAALILAFLIAQLN